MEGMTTVTMATMVVLLVTSLPGLPSALPMTDYSQLNHDEPTHWTKAATTQTSPPEGAMAWSVLSRVRSHLASQPRKHPQPKKLQPTRGTPPTSQESWTKSHNQLSIETSKEPPRSTKNPLDEIFQPEDKTTSRYLQEKTTGSSVESIPGGFSTSPPKEQVQQDQRTAETPRPDFGVISDIRTSSEALTDATMSPRTPGPKTKNDSLLYDRFIYPLGQSDSEDKNYFEEETTEGGTRSTTAPDYGPEDRANDNDYFRGPEGPTYKTPLVHKADDPLGGFDSEQEEEELASRKDEVVRSNALYDSLALPTMGEGEEIYDGETPFKEWDHDSEEQEKILENIVMQPNNNETGEQDEDHPSARWFVLLLAGNSTIVKLRQKDFAKYLKLNLAARLSLEYDELRVNRVIVAPPRLVVNVSVLPSEAGDLDQEFDINERIFGEEEAPLHKLAETNATLLELSGEEYHVVRFLSLRSERPMSLEEAASETTSVVVTDKHTDIEKVIYVGVGGACIIVLVPLVFALCRLYVLTKKIRWPWKREKPLFGGPRGGPRHRRMEEPPPPVGGPLTVIYSGSFVERNGPPSGSWLEDEYRQNSSILREEPSLENPVYGLEKTGEFCDPTILDSPRFNIDSRLHILGCRPGHLLLPHTPLKQHKQHHNTSKDTERRIPKGLDNPNYQT